MAGMEDRASRVTEITGKRLDLDHFKAVMLGIGNDEMLKHAAHYQT